MTQGSPNGGERYVYEMTPARTIARMTALMEMIGASLEEFHTLAITITGSEDDTGVSDALFYQVQGVLGETIDRLAGRI